MFWLHRSVVLIFCSKTIIPCSNTTIAHRNVPILPVRAYPMSSELTRALISLMVLLREILGLPRLLYHLLSKI